MNRMMNDECGRSSGFTILEVMVAIAVLAAGAGAALLLFQEATRHARDAAMAGRAALLAESAYAEVAAAFDLSADLRELLAARQDAAHPDYPGLRYTVEAGTIDPAGESASLLIRVRWSAVPGEEEVFHGYVRRRLRARDVEPITRERP